ncbi:MAG: hypothetical protein HY359_12160 [Candidatus Rokubacteria bacterium]|nr:hypothetical protein [Candidatus Rokubacteria bacterium]
MTLCAAPARPAGVLRAVLPAPLVPPALLLRLQKYRDLGRVPPAIRQAAEEVAAEASRLVAPQAVLWRGPVTAVAPDGRVTLAGRHRFGSRVLARLLAPCPEALVFVLTAGSAIERRARELLDAKLLVEGFLMDTAGWAAIELLVRELRRRLREAERPAGRALTHRLAPGYCDWPVDEQLALLGVFGDAPLPVSVNEAACLSPQKSISGVFGVHPVAG